MDPASELKKSWDKNAGNWTRAVRDGLIPSRKAGTDAAILAAIRRHAPKRLLDVGCGEGWLVRRATRETGCSAQGVDGAAQLVAAARDADPGSRYDVVTYDDLIGGNHPVAGKFDAIVFNYALFDERAAELLAAVRPLLADGGVVIIQTLHPWTAAPAGGYRDGWHSEDFTAFENQNWTAMPWYFRRLETWFKVIRTADLVLVELEEPRAEPGAAPLSLLMTCRAGG